MHFATFLLLHVKHLQLKIVCASNRAGWSVDSYVLSKNLCDSNMIKQITIPKGFGVFIFPSACSAFLLFHGTIFPFAVLVLFYDLNYKNAW